MNVSRMIRSLRRRADAYERHTEYLRLHHPIQSIARCPGCTNGTRGGTECPACLRAIAVALAGNTSSNRRKVAPVRRPRR